MIAQMQVVEANVHLVDALDAHRVCQVLRRRVRFQQRHDFRAAANHLHKLTQVLHRAPHGQHDHIRTVGDSSVDLFL